DERLSAVPGCLEITTIPAKALLKEYTRRARSTPTSRTPIFSILKMDQIIPILKRSGMTLNINVARPLSSRRLDPVF
ncbi:MAG: hypothetical protein ACPGF8_07960, partial [Opitutales bacterium]